MVIYIGLFFTILMLGLPTKYEIVGKKGRVLNVNFYFWSASFISVALVEGLRDSSVGIDLPAYLRYFLNSRKIVFDAKYWIDFSGIEPGYNFLNRVLVDISDQPRFFIFSTSVIIVFLHTWFLYKNSKDLALSMLLFLGFNHFFTSMVSLRQFIAMGFVLWCYPAMLKKQYVKAAIFAVMAFYFHQSSAACAFIIVMAVLFKEQKRLVKWVFIAAIIMIPAVYTIYSYVLSLLSKYEFYAVGNNESGLGRLRFIYILMQTMLVVYSMIRHKDDKDEIITSMSILLIVAIYVGVVGSVIPLAFRLGYYFDYFMLLYIPELLEPDSQYYKLFRFGVILISIVFFGYYLTVNPGVTIPYKFYGE